MRLLRGILAIALAVLGGCATHGRDFAKPVADDLVLGQTTKNEIVGRFGAPMSERTVTARLKQPGEKEGSENPNAEEGLVTTMSYSYVEPMGEAAEGVSPQRAAYFWLWNGKLVGYEYLSSFRADSTNFNDDLISKIEKSRTTESEVIALMGRPIGHAIYPRTRHRGDRSLAYAYFEWNKNRRESVMKRLIVNIMPNGTVRDYFYDNRAKPLPAPPPVPTVIPIYIPRGR